MLVDDVRRVTALAENLVSELLEASGAVDDYRSGEGRFYAKRFIKHAYAIEDLTREWDWSREVRDLFAAANQQPIETRECPAASVHAAIHDQGLLIGEVAEAVLADAYPGTPGVHRTQARAHRANLQPYRLSQCVWLGSVESELSGC